LYKQVTDIIKEIVPNVEFVDSKDVYLYINFASSMKRQDVDTYTKAMKRYDRKSLLYSLFIEDKGKERLSEKECDLLKECIHMTFESYSQLEKINPNLKFDIIKQMGEVKTRG